jgi:hypothetical protein
VQVVLFVVVILTALCWLIGMMMAVACLINGTPALLAASGIYFGVAFVLTTFLVWYSRKYDR